MGARSGSRRLLGGARSGKLSPDGDRQWCGGRSRLSVIAGQRGLPELPIMKLDLAHAEPMGTLILEGRHQPFRALACALRPSAIRIRSAR